MKCGGVGSHFVEGLLGALHLVLELAVLSAEVGEGRQGSAGPLLLSLGVLRLRPLRLSATRAALHRRRFDDCVSDRWVNGVVCRRRTGTW